MSAMRATFGIREIVTVLRRNPNFARMYAAQLVSYLGDWFAVVALQGLILTLTHNPFLAGLMFTVQMGPIALTSLFAGVVVDRTDRRWLMVTADLLRAVLALGFLLVHSRGTLWLAFAAMAAISIVSAFFDPASSAVLPNFVRSEDLAIANILIGTTWSTMLAVGAALGGVVAITLGRNASFLGDAASFLVSALLLVSVRGNFRVPKHEQTGGTVLADVREMVRFARAEPRVRSMLLVKAGFGFTAGVIALIGVMAIDVFGRGDTGTGILFSARGLGALIGPFLMRAIFGDSDRALFRAVAVSFGVFGAGYIVFGLGVSLWIAAVGCVIAHIGGASQWAFSTIGLQRFSPDRIRGRIFGADYMLSSLTMASSFAIVGWLANVFGPKTIAIGFAVAAILYSAVWTAMTRERWPADVESKAA